jgi:hypothetical protein
MLPKPSREIKKWLARNDLSLDAAHTGSIVVRAIRESRLDILKWLHGQPGIAEACRASNRDPLRGAAIYGKMDILEWLDAQGAVTPDDCRANNFEILLRAMNMYQTAAAKWLFQRLDDGGKAEFIELCRSEKNYSLWCGHFNHDLVMMNWMRQLGVVTVETCRARENGILYAAVRDGSITVLEWLESFGAATAEDFRSNQYGVLHGAVLHFSPAVMEWVARRLPLAEVEEAVRAGEYWDYTPGCDDFILMLRNFWKLMRQRQARETMLALVVAGKRKKRRLLPELWGMINDLFL